jgi:hypothetical protein
MEMAWDSHPDPASVIHRTSPQSAGTERFMVVQVCGQGEPEYFHQSYTHTYMRPEATTSQTPMCFPIETLD